MNRSFALRAATALLFAVSVLACDPDTSGPSDGGTIDAGGLCSVPGAIVCNDNASYRCRGGDAGVATLMARCGDGMQCVPGMGCRVCAPNARSCDASGVPQVCNGDGSGFAPGEPCGAGLTCAYGRCADLCAEARMNNSYVGCEYWAVPTSNSNLGSFPQTAGQTLATAGAVGVDGFAFAVVVANSFDAPATVHVTGGALTGELMQTVPPRQLVTIRLPWVQATSSVVQHGARMGNLPATVLATRAAYHLVSDLPVVAYQFNPLNFRDSRRASCALDDQTCYSFTNDSSLLLPAHTLTGNYNVLAWPSQADTDGTQLTAWRPGFVTIVGTAPNTTVSIRLTAYTVMGTGVPEQGAPGMTITKTLGPGDVLQLVSGAPNVTNASVCMHEPLFSNPANGTDQTCRPVASFDLTGSIVTASQPVAVFGGHDCAFVPYNRYACDHLEEQLFPSESLGTRYVVSGTVPQLARGEPTIVRVLSNAANNQLTFDPPLMGAPIVLARGQSTDLTLTDGVVISGTGPMAVAQLLVGQNYFSNDEPLPPGTADDPSLVLEVPVEQWRASYDFLTPDTYTRSYVNVVAPHDARIALDGTTLVDTGGAAVTTVAVGGYTIWRVDLSSRPGPHHIESEGNVRFSVKVYGFGSYTSYMYPGGLDLTRISPPG